MKKKRELIYEEESYEIIGAVYEVFNKLEYGHKEKVYHKAIAEEFKRRNIQFKSELRAKIRYKGEEIGVYILDFWFLIKLQLN